MPFYPREEGERDIPYTLKTRSVFLGSSFKSFSTSFNSACVPLTSLFTLESAEVNFVVFPPISIVIPFQFKRGEVSEEQYRALKREIEATELSLKNLESQAKESNVTLESVGQAFERVGDKATSIGNKLMPVTAGITALGGAGIAAAMDLDDGYDTIIIFFGFGYCIF